MNYSGHEASLWVLASTNAVQALVVIKGFQLFAHCKVISSKHHWPYITPAIVIQKPVAYNCSSCWVTVEYFRVLKILKSHCFYFFIIYINLLGTVACSYKSFELHCSSQFSFSPGICCVVVCKDIIQLFNSFFLVSAEKGAAISELENLTIRLLDEFYSSVLFDK